jgi:hypothetical protein
MLNVLYAECLICSVSKLTVNYTECHKPTMLCVIMLNVVILSVIVLAVDLCYNSRPSVTLTSVVRLNVLALVQRILKFSDCVSQRN